MVLNPGDQEIAFDLSGTPQDPPPGFRVEGCAVDIDPGIRLRTTETATVCLPPAEIKGESYIHRYDDEWELLPSQLETVDDGTTTGNELLCGKTDTFSPLFRVSIPEIESAQGVTHSEDKVNHVFSLTPVGEGGSIVYGEETIGLSVTGDTDPSSGDPAIIVPRDILDHLEEITFELSEVSPHDPPPGYRLQGFTAKVDLGVALGEGETVSVCLPSSGGEEDIYYRYNGSQRSGRSFLSHGLIRLTGRMFSARKRAAFPSREFSLRKREGASLPPRAGKEFCGGEPCLTFSSPCPCCCSFRG